LEGIEQCRQGVSTCIEFHRRTLERQRDALRGVGSWYLLPLVPGIAVIMIGTAVNKWTAHPVGMGHLVMGYGIVAGLIGAVFFVVWKLNQRGLISFKFKSTRWPHSVVIQKVVSAYVKTQTSIFLS
jgi:hypothetical protein